MGAMIATEADDVGASIRCSDGRPEVGKLVDVLTDGAAVRETLVGMDDKDGNEEDAPVGEKEEAGVNDTPDGVEERVPVGNSLEGIEEVTTVTGVPLG